MIGQISCVSRIEYISSFNQFVVYGVKGWDSTTKPYAQMHLDTLVLRRVADQWETVAILKRDFNPDERYEKYKDLNPNQPD